MKKNQLLINFIANITAFAVDALLSFFITRYLVGRVGTDAYGFIPLANNMVNYIMIFAAALNTMTSRFVSAQINSGQTGLASVYYNSAMRVNFMIALALSVPAVPAVLFIDKILDVPPSLAADVRLTFVFVFVNMAVSLLGNIFSCAAFSKNRLELTAMRRTEGNLIKIALTVILFVFFEPRIYYISLCVIAMTLYTVAANVIYTKKLTPELRLRRGSFSGGAVKTLVGSSVWIILDQLGVMIMTGIDILLANIFLGASEAGRLALAKTLPVMIISLVGSAVAVFVPRFVIHHARGETEELRGCAELSARVLGGIVIVPTSVILVFGQDFFALWLPGENAALLQLLSALIIIPMTLTACANPLYSLFTAINRMRVPAIVMFANGALNLIITVVLLRVTQVGVTLIPAVALASGTLTKMIFTPLYAAKCMGERRLWFYPIILRGFICSVLAVGICFIYKRLFYTGSWLTLAAAAAVCCLIGAGICAAVLFKKSELRDAWSMISRKT